MGCSYMVLHHAKRQACPVSVVVSAIVVINHHSPLFRSERRSVVWCALDSSGQKGEGVEQRALGRKKVTLGPRTEHC